MSDSGAHTTPPSVPQAGVTQPDSDGDVGLQTWLRMRSEWLNKRAPRDAQSEEGATTESTVGKSERQRRLLTAPLHYDAVYNELNLGQATGVLPQPVPLADVVSILVEQWEAKGMFV